MAAGNHYSRAEVQEVLATCKDLGLEVSMLKSQTLYIFYLAPLKGLSRELYWVFDDIHVNKKIEA